MRDWIRVQAERLLSLWPFVSRAMHEREMEKCQRQAQELRSVTYRLWELFEQNPVALVFLDRYGRARHINRKMVEMLGYPQSQLGSMTYHEYVHPDDVPVVDELFQALVSGTRNDYRAKIRCVYNPEREGGLKSKQDQTIYCILHLQRLDVGGDGIVAMAMLEDVSKLHHYQRRLEESNYQLAERNKVLERVYRNVELIAFGVVGGAPEEELMARIEGEPGGETSPRQTDPAQSERP